MSDTPGPTGDPILDAAGHALALRTVLGAAITNVDAILAALGAQVPQPMTLNEPGACTHPLDKRKDYTPNGTTAERWTCGVCGEKGGAW